MLEEHFGQLRSILQFAPHFNQNEFLSLLHEAYDLDSERYTQEFIPYLKDFSLPHFLVCFKKEAAEMYQAQTVEAIRHLLPEDAVYLFTMDPDEFFPEYLHSELLRDLHVAIESGYADFSPELARNLASSPTLTKLVSLTLTSCRITDESVHELTDSDLFAHTTYINFDWNDIGSSGARALAHCKALSNLQFLGLNESPIGNAGIGHLAESLYLHDLHSLYIESCALSGHGCAALANACFASNLKELWMSKNQPDIQGLHDLGSGTRFDALEYLFLCESNLHPAHIEAFTKHHESYPALLGLDVSGNPLGFEGLTILLETPLLASATQLSLSNTNLNDAALDVFLSSPHTSSLEYLSLYQNRLTNHSVQMLASRGEHLKHLKRLALGQNEGITPEGMEVLRTSKTLPKGLEILFDNTSFLIE